MKLTAPRPATIPAFKDEFDRLLEQMTKGPWLGAAPILESRWIPTVDFSETEKEFVARLEVPGVARDDLEVNVDGRMLTITGNRNFEKEEKGEDFFWRERERGRFVRTLQLPAAVDHGKVTAMCQDGVLTVRMPKAEPTPRSRVQIT